MKSTKKKFPKIAVFIFCGNEFKQTFTPPIINAEMSRFLKLDFSFHPVLKLHFFFQLNLIFKFSTYVHMHFIKGGIRSGYYVE